MGCFPHCHLERMAVEEGKWLWSGSCLAKLARLNSQQHKHQKGPSRGLGHGYGLKTLTMHCTSIFGWAATEVSKEMVPATVFSGSS